VDVGIFAAEETADYAKLQLDAMANAVSILGAINTNTAATATALLNAASTNQEASAPSASSSSSDLQAAIEDLKAELSQMRSDNNAGHAATASNTGAMKRKLEDITAASGGDAISMVSAL
jgi:outer membrane murein-binding lipoprotein Lpp